ncbi:hypothetical protein [Candidatus Uabimicrobium sp. HlEnr_7]
MDLSQENIRIIILKSPYDYWNEPLVQDLFVKMVSNHRKTNSSFCTS